MAWEVLFVSLERDPQDGFHREGACLYDSREAVETQCYTLERLLLIALRVEIAQRCPAPWKLARAFETVSLPKLINTP